MLNLIPNDIGQRFQLDNYRSYEFMLEKNITDYIIQV